MILCINEQLPPGGHPRESRGICRGCQLFVAPGVGENIAFVHRAHTPGGRPWGFAGQRYIPLTIPRCCLRCSLHALVAGDLGLELTKFRRQVSIVRSSILGSTQSPNFMYIPGTHSAQKPYILRSLSPIGFGHFFSILERKRKERKKLYLPRVNYIITGNLVVNITALKTLKESLKKYTYIHTYILY